MRRCEAFELVMANGEVVRGDHHFTPHEGETPVVVFAHGLGSDRTGEKIGAFEAECAQRGWALVAADFRGHGQSDGKMVDLSGPRLLEDLAAIVRLARQRDGGPLLLVGSSMGGWTAAWLTIAYPELAAQVDACALIAPALRFFDWLNLDETERASWLETGRHRLRTQYLDMELGSQLLTDASDYAYDNLRQRFARPAVIFHGMRDETIPYQLSLDFIEHAEESRLELFLSREGDHRLITQKEQMARESCHLLARVTNRLAG
jgi:uncharacterized protein